MSWSVPTLPSAKESLVGLVQPSAPLSHAERFAGSLEGCKDVTFKDCGPLHFGVNLKGVGKPDQFRPSRCRCPVRNSRRLLRKYDRIGEEVQHLAS